MSDFSVGNIPVPLPWSGRSRSMFPRTPSSFTWHKSCETPMVAAASWLWKIFFKIWGTGWNFWGEGTLSKPRSWRKSCSWNCNVWPKARVNKRPRAKTGRGGSMASELRQSGLVRLKRGLAPDLPEIQALLIYLPWDNQVWIALFPAPQRQLDVKR